MLKIFARIMANFPALVIRPHPLHPLPYDYAGCWAALMFATPLEVTFDCGLANIRALVVRGLYCPSSQNLWFILPLHSMR